MSSRFRVLLRPGGRTQPYEDGAPREIWPDGRFPGYPPIDDSTDNADGYRWNSMPLMYLHVTANGRSTRALFLIDSGATSEVKCSLHLKHQLLGLMDGNDVAGKHGALKIRLSNDVSDGQLAGSALPQNASWVLESLTAELRVDRDGKPSPRENSVVGLPWMAKVQPLFEFEGTDVPLPLKRLAIRFPADGSKGWYVVSLRNPATGMRLPVPVAIDTGAPISTFPKKYVDALGLTPAQTRSYPDATKRVFNWFAYDSRTLYDAEFCEAEGVSPAWSVGNTPVGLTARDNEWGLLGMDFLLAVKPLIIYGHAQIDGQREGVDYAEVNVMNDVGRSTALSYADRTGPAAPTLFAAVYWAVKQAGKAIVWLLSTIAPGAVTVAIGALLLNPRLGALIGIQGTAACLRPA